MSKSESLIMKTIQISSPEYGAMLFRNNTGAYKTDAGHYVQFGVGGKGGSDLIGITPVTITKEMVGETVGVLTAIEVKSARGKPTEAQIKFITAVKKQGAIAGIARSVDDVKKIIGEWLNERTNK